MSEARLVVVQGDLTQMAVDAVVNAANSRLKAGGGVDGALHRAAGPGLQQACDAIGGCQTGSAVITDGFDLPARYVIHAVGPVWRGGDENEAALLASAYRGAMAIASENQLESVAFAALSCGAYGFPLQQAAKIAVQTLADCLRRSEFPAQAIMCCFDHAAFAAMGTTHKELG